MMKAIKLIPKKKDSLEILEVPLPKKKENEVLIKTLFVGLDGTDKDIIGGKYGLAPKNEKQLIIGHECLGKIIHIGSKIKNLKVGDFVVPMVRRPDDCINCKNGEQDMCIKGDYTERGIKGENGFLSEYFTEKEEYLIKIPKKLPKNAVLLEPLSVVEKAIRQVYECQKRMVWKPKTALVTGSGTLGILASLLLKLRGLDVIIVDRKEDKIKKRIFNQVGIRRFSTNKVNLHDIPKIIKKPIDIIIESTGNSTVAMHSMMVAGTNSAVVLLSITGGEQLINLCSDCFNDGLVLNNKTIIGSVNANKKDFDKGVKDLITINKKWPKLLGSIITKEYCYKDIEMTIKEMRDNIKSIIYFDEDLKEGSKR